MPTVMMLSGFRFYFYSRKESRVHIHVAKDGFEAKIWLDNFEIASNSGFKKRELLLIQKLVKDYEKEIKVVWSTHFNRSRV